MRILLFAFLFLFSKGILHAQSCTVTISNPTPSICLGAPAVLTASGATTYSWSTGATTASISVSPTTTTVYTVTGIAGTCTQVVTTTVTVKPLPTLVISPASPTVCFSSALTLTVSGASTYTWSTGATTTTISVTPTVNTTYTATGTGTNACVNSIVKTVTVNPNLVLTNSTPTICIGSSAPLVASGATTYSWSTGATTASISVSPTIATTYTVRGTSGSCSRTLSATVTPIALPNTTVSASSLSVCAGGSVTLTASGATTYSWSTGATTTSVVVTPTATTTYTVRGTSNGCSKTVSVTITRVALPTVAIAPTSPTLCNGSAIILTASGASTYTWNTGPTTATISLSPTVTTSYSVTATATTGCKNTAVKAVTVVAIPNVTISNPTPTVCAGKSRTITASGATTYTWNTSATTASIAVSPTLTTTYTVTGSTAGCSKTATTTVSVTALPNLTISPTTATICNGSTITLTGSGASTYTWNTGPTTATISLSPTVTTNYTVTGTAASGCSNTAVRTVTVSNSLVATNPTPTVCVGTSTILSVSGSSTYSWSTGPTTSSISVTPTVTTTYTVRGTIGACVKTISITVTVMPIPSVGITSSTPSICVGVYATLTGTGATTYSWSTGATTTSISVSPTVTTIYTVTGTSSFGCSKTATTSIDASCNFNYNSIGYKTAWTNFAGTLFRNDSILIAPANFYSWPHTVSKNTLKANTNGWVEVALPAGADYLMLGFHDSTSVTHSSYTDIDYGFLKQQNLFYLIIDGVFYYNGTVNAGDIVRMDRTSDVLTYKINGVVQYTANGIPTNRNWKLKTAINTNAIANIGASFVDSTAVYFPNYVQDYPKITHCTPGQNNGSINLTPKLSGTQTFTWSTGSNNSTISGLAVGDFNVDVKDANLNLSNQKYSVGYKTNWTNFFGLQQRNDSLLVGGQIVYAGWPFAISKNTLRKNTDGWAQVVLDQNTDYLILGFHDSSSVIHSSYSDIDFGIYKEPSVLYIVIDGILYAPRTCVQGDVVKIERTGNTFYIKINGAIQFQTTVSTAKDWKLKTALNTNAIANIGASFTDSTGNNFPNYVQNNVLVKHSSGLNINDGRITLSPKSNSTGDTYQWLQNDETTPYIENKPYGAYDVNITDYLSNTSLYKYDILYRVNWENLDGCFSRQDSLISLPASPSGWNTAAGKNILKANTDGEISWIVPNTAQHQMIGFADTLSGVPGDLNDVDYGLYSNVFSGFTVLYRWINGAAYAMGQTIPGDILKIKRKQDTVIYLLNDAVLAKTQVINSNVDWKVKAAFSTGYNCGAVGCSFNTDLNATIIKEHADYDNLHNGFAYIMPYNGAPSYTVSWVDGMISDTRNDLSVGSHIATVTDSLGIKLGKDFAIGVKPVWNINQGINYLKDSLELLGGTSTGALISHNTSFNNEEAWFEFKVTNKNTDLAFGFIGNPKTAMDTSFVPAIFSSALMEQRLRHAKQLYAKATNTTLTYAGGRLAIDSSATNLFYVRLYNGNLLSLVNTATTTQYPINNGDVIRIGRNEDGNFYLAVNGTALVKYPTNIKDQYLVSSFLTNASKVKVSQVGIYTKVPLEVYPEHIIIKDPKCLNDVCRNWSVSRVYNENGAVVSESKQYYDNLGRPTQAQQKIISENNILANETIYDSYGRPTGETLPAPLFTGAFCYNNVFFTNGSNQHYGVDDFDKPNTINKYYGEKYNPALVGNSNQGTLGWYYSNNNTNNLYVPADSFPYNRVEYYNDPLNRVYKSSDVGRFHKLGSGHETQTFYLNSGYELQAIYQKIVPNQLAHSYELNDDFESLTYNIGSGTHYNNNVYHAHKTVEVNEDGHDYVTYTNSLGQVLATCTSGYDASCGSYPVTNNVVKKVFSLIHLPKQENNSLSFACTPVALTNIVPVIRLYTTKQVLVLGTDYSFNTTSGAVTFFGDYATTDLFIELSYDLAPAFTALPTGVTETHKTGYTNWTVYYYDVKGRLKAYISPNDFKCPAKFSSSFITTSTVPSAFSCDPSTPLASLSIPADTTGNNTSPDVSIQFKPMFTSIDTLRTVFSATDFYLQTNDTLAPIDTLMALQFFKTSFQDSLVTDTVTTARIHFNDSLYQIEKQLLADSAFKLLDGKEIVYKGNYIIGKRASGITTYFDSLRLPFNFTVKFIGRQAVFENNSAEEFLTFRLNAENLVGANSLVIKCDSFKIQAKGFYNSPVNSFNPCNQSMWVGEQDAQLLATINSNINLNLISSFIISPQPTSPPSAADYFTKKFYYNKYDHLVATETKDEGRTDYFYDLKEDKLFYTQNDKQRANGGKFNYMKYDGLGRVIESGEYDPALSDPSVTFNFQFQTYDDYDNAVATNPGFTSVGGYAAASDNIPATLRCTQATNIEYSKADGSNPLISTYPQKYLNGKISKTFNDKQTTWYSYDEEGQLEYSVQDMAGFAVKTMDYNYDFFGNLNYSTYQLGQSDEFKHMYTYDADLNLKKTQFTRPGFSLPQDAALYSYYLHGPLKRQVLGNKLQGLDYVYTIRGALKSVNNPFNAATITNDPGSDGSLSTAATFDDFFAYALDYYPNDYERGTSNPMAAKNLNTSYSQLNISYTGQISAFRWNRSGTAPNEGISGGPYIYEFNYDELYRLKSADYGTYFVNSTSPPTYITGASNSFKLENITYDKIGNIKTLKRYAKAATANAPVLMDNLTYNYNTTIKNRLKNVSDAITGSLGYNAETDLPHQSTTANYVYDEIGQVITNVQDNQRYEYNASGLVTKIINNTTNFSVAEFEYNDKGLRSAKTVYNSGGTATSKRFYVYDAGGSQVASYERTSFPSGAATLQDFSIYSGGRIGLYDVATSKAQYELTDHLGNVRTVFTDGANYAASILQTTDYYPHGGPLAGANYYSSTAYRYGHQGQERDVETGMTSFELRQMDPRLGRWISPDPYAQHHSPYLSMSNNPVNNIDPDGGFDVNPNSTQYGMSDGYMQGQGYSQTETDAARLQLYGNFSDHKNFKPADCSFDPSAQELKMIAFNNYLQARQVEKSERKALLDKQKLAARGGYHYTINRKPSRAQEAANEAILNETQVFEYSYRDNDPLIVKINNASNNFQKGLVNGGYGAIKDLVKMGVGLFTGDTWKGLGNVVMTYADTQLHPIKNLGDPYDQVWLSQVRSLGDLSAEDWGYGVGYGVVSALGVKGLGSTKIGIGFGNVFQRGSLTNGSTKSILTYEKLIKTHKKKLADYIKNPSKYDNKGFLKNAPTDKIRDKIIKQRINHLRKEINTFENNIKKIKKGEL